MTLDAMPPDMLYLIMRQLKTEDLAAVSAQNRYLRTQAGEDDLWRPHLDSRWPDCCTGAHYPSCRAAYSMRAAMPASLALYVDRIAKLRTRMASDGSAQSQSMLEATMRTLHMVGPLLDLAPPGLVLKRTAEHRRLVSDLCWWLKQKPGVAVAFVDATTQLVHDGSGSTLQVRWRRSSIAVLARLLRCTPCQALHPSVCEALRSATARLDRSIKRSQVQAGAVAASRPRQTTGSCWRTASFGAVGRCLTDSPRLVASPA